MMYAICTILGAFFGFLCALAFFMGSLVDKSSNPADNLTRRLEETAKAWGRPKGGIIYPKTDEMIAMEETFARNDKEGKDTNVGEIESA